MKLEIDRRRSCAHAALVCALALGSAQAAVADTYPRIDGVDVEEYVFRLTLGDDSDAIEGLATIEVRFERAGVTELPLDGPRPAARSVAGAVVAVALAAGVARRLEVLGSAHGWTRRKRR